MTDVIAGLVKAFDGAAKGVEFFKGISHCQEEYESFCDDIDDIRGLVELALEINQPSAGTKTILSNATKRLEKVVKQLQDFQTEIQGRQADKVNKAQWLAKGRKMETLLECSRKARELLSEAIQLKILQQTTILVRETSAMPSQLSLLAEITTRYKQEMWKDRRIAYPQSMIIQSNKPSRIQELAETDEDGNNIDRNDGTMIKIPYQNVEKDYVGQTSNAWAASGFRPMQKRACGYECRCSCHSKGSHLQGPGWIGKIFGSWNINYYGILRETQSDEGCGCDKVTSIWADYRPPAWLWSNVVVFNATYGTGGLRCALRAARVVPLQDDMWDTLRATGDAVQRFILNGQVIYPDDRMEDGVEVIEDLMVYKNFDSLELLLTRWESVLAERGISRRASYRLHWELARTTLSEAQMNILRRFQSYAGDEIAKDSKLHTAARWGWGIQEAIGEVVDINEVGITGLAPLHLAAERDHAEAAQKLIEAGAGLNVRDAEGNTPLMRAALNNSVECMRRLMLAGCDINCRNDGGEDALYVAARYARVDAVRLLVQQGAKCTRNIWGRTPLHNLAFITENAPDADATDIQETARLLLAMDQANINAADDNGHTPINVVLECNNLPLARSLVEAGASLTSLGGAGNWLHYAALFCTAELLRFLATLPLPAVDTCLRSAQGNTPWDLFIWSINAQTWQLTNHHRNPDLEAQSAFVALYTAMRNKNIRHDLSLLRQAQESLSNEDGFVAAAHLSSLAKTKSELHNHDLATFYRGLSKEIHGGHMDAALRAIQEEIEYLTDEILSSPWNNDSYWDVYSTSTSTTFESDCHQSEPDQRSYQHSKMDSYSSVRESCDDDENDSEQSMELSPVPPRARRNSI